jgi:hypothetical protein
MSELDSGWVGSISGRQSSLPEMVSRLQGPRPGSVRPARSLTLFRRPRSPPHNPTICPRILVSFKNLSTCKRYSKPRCTKGNERHIWIAKMKWNVRSCHQRRHRG